MCFPKHSKYLQLQRTAYSGQHTSNETDLVELPSCEKCKFKLYTSKEWARKVSATLRIQEESVSADTMPSEDKYWWNVEKEDGDD